MATTLPLSDEEFQAKINKLLYGTPAVSKSISKTTSNSPLPYTDEEFESKLNTTLYGTKPTASSSATSPLRKVASSISNTVNTIAPGFLNTPSTQGKVAQTIGTKATTPTISSFVDKLNYPSYPEIKQAAEKSVIQKGIDEWKAKAAEENAKIAEKKRVEALPLLGKVQEPFKNINANVVFGDLSEKENLAWGEYRKKQDSESRTKALEATARREEYQTNNINVGKGNAITKSFPQYVPQLGRQLGSGVAGAAIAAPIGVGIGAGIGSLAGGVGAGPGAIGGGIKGAQVGYVGGTAKYGYDTMSGAAYKNLIDLGVSNEIALEISGDEALISSLIEGGGAVVDLITLSIGKLATKPLSTAAKKTAQNRLLSAAGAYGLNIGSNYLEESLQEGVTINSEKQGMQQSGIYKTPTTFFEDLKRMNEAGKQGATISAIAGGGNIIGNVAVNTIANNRIKANTNPETMALPTMDKGTSDLLKRLNAQKPVQPVKTASTFQETVPSTKPNGAAVSQAYKFLELMEKSNKLLELDTSYQAKQRKRIKKAISENSTLSEPEKIKLLERFSHLNATQYIVDAMDLILTGGNRNTMAGTVVDVMGKPIQNVQPQIIPPTQAEPIAGQSKAVQPSTTVSTNPVVTLPKVTAKAPPTVSTVAEVMPEAVNVGTKLQTPIENAKNLEYNANRGDNYGGQEGSKQPSQVLDGGRSDTTDIGTLQNDNGTIQSRGESVQLLAPNSNAQKVYDIVKSAKESNSYGAFVDLHDDYSKYKNFTLENGKGSVSVGEDGNVSSVVSSEKGNGKRLVLTALKNGGTKLDNYDGFLTETYEKLGFEPVARVKFNPEYAPPDWNYQRDGERDIIVMKHNGDTAEMVGKKYGTYKHVDINSLPYMEYEEALKYRDGLINKPSEVVTSKEVSPAKPTVDKTSEGYTMLATMEKGNVPVKLDTAFQAKQRAEVVKAIDENTALSQEEKASLTSRLSKLNANPYVLESFKLILKENQPTATKVEEVKPTLKVSAVRNIDNAYKYVETAKYEDIQYLREAIAEANNEFAKDPGRIDLQHFASKAMSKIDELVKQYGAIKKGENPVRDVTLPNKISKDQYVSQFARTMAEAGVTTDQGVDLIKSMVEDGTLTHERITDKAAMDSAIETITTNGFKSAINTWDIAFKNNTVLDKNTMALGQQIYNQAVQNEDLPLIKKMIVDLTLAKSLSGQSLQASRMFKKITPDGKLYYLEKSLGKINQDMLAKYKDNYKEISIPDSLAKELLKAKDMKEADIVVGKIEEYIAKRIPSTFLDKLNAWRYMSMLGNWKTHIRNIGGNVLSSGMRGMKNIIGIPLELTIPKDQRTKAIVTRFNKNDKALLDYASKYFDENKKSITGESKWGMDKGIESKREIFKTNVPVLNVAAKGLEGYRKVGFSALEGEDYLFLKGAYVSSLAQTMKARGLTADNITSKSLEDANAYAIEEAQKATFRDFSAFANKVVQYKNHLNSEYKATKSIPKKIGIAAASMALEGVMPFPKTPVNILKRAKEYSPYGLVKGISDALTSVKSGEITASKAIDQISAGLSGTAIMVLGGLLAKYGILSGATEDEKEAAFEKLQGSQNYSVHIGDKSYSLDWATPASIPLFMGVEVYNLLTSKGDKDPIASLARVTEPVFEFTVLNGLSTAIESAKYNKTNTLAAIGGNMVLNYFNQYNPTLLGQIAKTIDGTDRTIYVDKNSNVSQDIQYTAQRNLAKVPFASKGLIPFVDQWGNTTEKKSLGARIFDNFINPGYVTTDKSTKVDKEIDKLYKVTGDTSILPAYAPKSFSVNKETKNLTAKEYLPFAQNRGKTAYSVLDTLVGSSQYSKLTDEQKALAIAKVYDYAGQLNKEKVTSEYNQDKWVAQAAELSKLGVPVSTYIALSIATKDIKDKVNMVKGKPVTIEGTAYKKKKAKILEIYPKIDTLSKTTKNLLYDSLGM